MPETKPHPPVAVTGDLCPEETANSPPPLSSSQADNMKRIFFLLVLVTYALADCQWWDGTAPFCDGSCPSTCRTESRSKSGNGATCWSGKKALCNCCTARANDLCTPTHKETTCYGVVLTCQKVEYTAGPRGIQRRVCSSYACGVCLVRSLLGIIFDKRDNTTHCNDHPRRPNITYINPIASDLIVRNQDITNETIIEELLVSKFGNRLSREEMEDVYIVETADIETTVNERECT